MKFGRAYTIYVETEAQRLIPKCPYVEFKRFKKLLKRCPLVLAAPEGSGDVSAAADGILTVEVDGRVAISEYDDRDATVTSTDLVVVEKSTSASEKHVPCPACDAQFFPDLDKAVSDVVGCFNSCAEGLLQEHMATGIRKYFIRLRRKLTGESHSMIQVGNMLVSYGCMNSLAVRKILKKYDKIHSSESGREFKSRLQGRRMELLQSPLLIELGALAVNLMSAQSVPVGLSLKEARGQHSCNFDDEKQTITYSLPDGLRLDFDLTCSICLEIVFDPIALSCGHIFCNSCACIAASVSTFDGVTSARRYRKCPICRQSGVYADAVSMGELHLLVSERCEEYYAERLPAERAKRVSDAKMHWETQTQKFLRN